jgi:hypothetical protein
LKRRISSSILTLLLQAVSLKEEDMIPIYDGFQFKRRRERGGKKVSGRGSGFCWSLKSGSIHLGGGSEKCFLVQF